MKLYFLRENVFFFEIPRFYATIVCYDAGTSFLMCDDAYVDEWQELWNLCLLGDRWMWLRRQHAMDYLMDIA